MNINEIVSILEARVWITHIEFLSISPDGLSGTLRYRNVRAGTVHTMDISTTTNEGI